MTEQKMAALYAKFDTLQMDELLSLRDERMHKIASMQLINNSPDVADELEVICKIIADRKHGAK